MAIENLQSVNIGLIGFGKSASMFHAPIIRSLPSYKIAAVVSSDSNKVHKNLPDVKVYNSVDELVGNSDVDLVVVTSPNRLHYEHAKKALLSNKHVIVEKPFVTEVSQGEELIEIADDLGLKLSVYHNRRWDNCFLTAKQLISDNQIGEIYTYECCFDRFRINVDHNKWKEQDQDGSGILYDLGSHLIDQALHLFGKPKSIFADIAVQRKNGTANDYFHLLMKYLDKRVILRSCSVVLKPTHHIAIHGSMGSYIKVGLDPQEDSLKNGLSPNDPSWGLEHNSDNIVIFTQMVNGVPQLKNVELLKGSYEEYYIQMLNALRNNSRVPILASDALEVIKIIKLAEKSNGEKREIEMS